MRPHRGDAQGAPDLAAAVEAVSSSLVAARGLRSGTLANRNARMGWFASFLHAHGVRDLDGVTPQQVADFVDSRRASGKPATLSERHSRLAAVRLLYKEARRVGLAHSDPMLDVELPPRRPTSARALTDSEVELGRSYALQTSDTRPAVCWSLAECTARTAEIPHIRVSDLDLAAGMVSIHGGTTTDPRLGRLTDWGAVQLERRLRTIGADEGLDPVLMGEGRWDDPDEGRPAATMALVSILKAARLAAPGVNPRSIPLWAGTKVLAEKGAVEPVALALGVRSLDQAAAMVGHVWREPGAP